MTNLIFDYDGTLHESLWIYAPAFRLGYSHLVQNGLALDKEFSDIEISRWLGFSAKEMWENFMPQLPQSEKDLCSKIVGDEMLRLTLAGKAKLYPDAENILRKLRAAGHNLIFLSNCKHNYMQAHRELFGLERYFSAFFCTEDFSFAPKWKIAESVLAEAQGNYIVIGDRWQDIEIAVHHQLLSIGCKYGYCSADELNSATLQVSSVKDILYAVENVSIIMNECAKKLSIVNESDNNEFIDSSCDTGGLSTYSHEQTNCRYVSLNLENE